MRPASRVAVRCASLKYAGTVMTARSTSKSNSPCSREVLLGALLQLAQDERGDLRRRELAIAEPDAHDAAGFAADAERQQRAPRRATSSMPRAHEALHRVHGARRRRSAAGAAPRGRRRSSRRRRPTRPTARARRRSRRGSRPARRPARRRRGCWWCRDRCRRLCPWLTQASARVRSGSALVEPCRRHAPLASMSPAGC